MNNDPITSAIEAIDAQIEKLNRARGILSDLSTESGPAPLPRKRSIGQPGAGKRCPGCGGPVKKLKRCKGCERELCASKCLPTSRKFCDRCQKTNAAGRVQKKKAVEPAINTGGPRRCPGCLKRADEFQKCASCGAEYCINRCLKEHDECPSCRATARGD